MQGIYIIKNDLNDYVYIGQSVDIQHRWNIHWGLGKKDANPNRLEYGNQIHTAMRELGREHFHLEILEECEKEKLNEREIYWIKYYNSYKRGYNGTEGGELTQSCAVGEANGRALLTEKDVEYIRECYNNHVCFREVYALYKDKITKRGLQKVWHFETWKHIHPEYHTEENREWHRTIAKINPPEVTKNNKRSFTDDEIRFMRGLYADGWNLAKIWKTYCPQRAFSTVQNAVKGITYKDVQ